MLPPQSAPIAGWSRFELVVTANGESIGSGACFAAAAAVGAVGGGSGGVAWLLSCGNLGRMRSSRRSPAGPCNRKSIGRTLDTTSPAATAVAAISTEATIALILETASVEPVLRARAITRAETISAPTG